MKKPARTLHPRPFKLTPLEIIQLADKKARTIARAPGPASPPETILEEAARVTRGDRQDFYGSPSENHTCTAQMWSAYLTRSNSGRPVFVSAADVCMLNILQKASRQAHAPKRDNLVDIAGYAANVEQMDAARESSREKGSNFFARLAAAVAKTKQAPRRRKR